MVPVRGRPPKRLYRPLKPLDALAVLKINPDGAGIVQAIGPFKTLAHADPRDGAVGDTSHRYRYE